MRIIGVVTHYAQGMSGERLWRILSVEGVAAFVPQGMDVPTTPGVEVDAQIVNTGFQRYDVAGKARPVSVPQFQLLSCRVLSLNGAAPVAVSAGVE